MTPTATPPPSARSRINAFIPEAYRHDIEALRQARLFVLACGLTSAFSASFAVASLAVGFEVGVVVMLGSVVGFLTLPALFRRTGSIALVVHLFLAVGVIGVGVCAYYSGGFRSGVIPWLAVLPIVGMLLGNARIGWMWTGVSVLIALGFAALEIAGHAAPFALDLERRYWLEVPDLVGLILMVFVVARVFEQGKAEALAKLERRNADLRRTLGELKTAQQQLIHAEKMASLGSLTAGIAHEIKNPLNFVTNFAGLTVELADDLASETDPAERAAILADIRENAGTIEAHGRRADAIVQSMMDHVRSGSGSRRRVDLNTLVEEYVGLAARAVEARYPDAPTVLAFELADDVGEAELVPEEIGRVIINLVDNALGATRDRFARAEKGYVPTVTVSTRRAPGRVEVLVADTGVGIAPDVTRKVFEPFFTTKPTGEGTGLGLSLAHDIVTLGHGGTLTVESVEGEGATFAFALPAASQTK